MNTTKAQAPTPAKKPPPAPPARATSLAGRVVNGKAARAIVIPGDEPTIALAKSIMVSVMGPGWDTGFLYRQPSWNGFDPPDDPGSLCRAEGLWSSESEVAAYAGACFAVCSQIPGARTYDASSVYETDPQAYPRNTLDSLYAGVPYDPALPVETIQVAVAVWYVQTQSGLPPRDVFGGE